MARRVIAQAQKHPAKESNRMDPHPGVPHRATGNSSRIRGVQAFAYCAWTEPDWNMPRAKKRVSMAANSKPIIKMTQRYFLHSSR